MSMDYEVVTVKAVDWSHYADQLSIDTDFGPLVGAITGFLIQESSDFVVLAHQLFEHGEQARATTCIPCPNIIEIIRYKAKKAKK